MKRIVTAVLVLVGVYAHGTHLKAGYITVERLNCSLEHRITLNIFISTSPNAVDFGGGTLHFGDGTSHVTPIITNSTPVPGLSNVGYIQHTVNYTYSGLGSYKIYYEEPNRNSGIINLPNSINIPFAIENYIRIDSFSGCVSLYPQFIAVPIFNATRGTNINISFAAKSDADLILDYSLVTPSGSFPFDVPNYELPENVSINPNNGLFTWNTVNQSISTPSGQYVFTVRVRIWKLVNEVLQIVGYTNIDVMIILEDSQIETDITPKEDLAENGRVYIPVGESKTLRFFSKDDQLADLTAYSELSTNEAAFSFTTYDSSSSDIKVGVLTLHATEEIDRDSPYIITIRGIREGTHFASDLNLMLYTRDLYPPFIVTGLADETAFEIFPNPTSDWLSVKTPPDSYSKIYLSNLNGERVGTWENSNKLNLTELSPGLYILKIETPEKRGIVKVIKR